MTDMIRSAVTGGGHVLDLKLVARIAKLEKAKGKELATKLGLMYTVEFSVHKIQILLQPVLIEEKKKKKKKLA